MDSGNPQITFPFGAPEHFLFKLNEVGFLWMPRYNFKSRLALETD